MAGINDYSNTPGSNTTINTIDVDEGCNPANINDAIRQLMADIADVDDGVVPLQTPDINGGTIDGASLGASSPITSATISGDLTVNTDALKVDSTNKFVGIGTASPTAELDIQADVPSIQLTDTDGTNQIGLVYANAGNLFLQSQNDTTNGGIGFRTYDGTTLSDTVRIDSSGNVGVNTTSPSRRLHVVVDGLSGAAYSSDIDAILENNTDTGLAILTPDGNVSRIRFGSASDASSATVNYNSSTLEFNIGSTRASSQTVFYSGNGNEAARFDASGNFGINTTTPSSPLTVNGYIESTTNGFKFPDASIQTTDGVTEIRVTYLTSGTSATFTPQTNTRYTQVTCTGGGGGGGGADGTDTANGSIGGGGGSGGTAIRTYNATEMGANATYTIGAAGAAGVGNQVGGTGGTGGTSTFDPAGTGSTLTANGGVGGVGIRTGAANIVSGGGNGGTASGGSINQSGSGGNAGYGLTGVDCFGGNGGSSLWGGSGKGAANVGNGNGTAGNANTGSGGGGAVSGASTAGGDGGAGGSGIIQIIEYIYN